jgi:hypothetical protein
LSFLPGGCEQKNKGSKEKRGSEIHFWEVKIQINHAWIYTDP